MSVYVIALVNIKNKDKFNEYGQLAGPTIGQFGGELVAKGKVAGLLTGTSDLNAVATMKFPTIENVESWYSSAEYQATIAVRNEACEMTLLKVISP